MITSKTYVNGNVCKENDKKTQMTQSAEASVSQASSICTGSTGCACLASLRRADFLRLLASDSGTPE